MESPDPNREKSASMDCKLTSFPVSSGLAFQQSCRPKASTALCNVRKISPLQRHHSRLVLQEGKYGIGVHAEMKADVMTTIRQRACKPSHLCCKTFRQRRRADLASGVELTAGVGDGGEASEASSWATALSTPSGRASGSVSRGASTRPACQEAASGIEKWDASSWLVV